MDFGMRFTDVLFPFAAFLFPAWPVIFLAPLSSRRNIVLRILVLWLAFWVVRMILLFSPLPTVASLIPEPLSTYLFLLAGALLIAGYALWVGRRRAL